jgi:hypothetical protein
VLSQDWFLADEDVRIDEDVRREVSLPVSLSPVLLSLGTIESSGKRESSGEKNPAAEKNDRSASLTGNTPVFFCFLFLYSALLAEGKTQSKEKRRKRDRKNKKRKKGECEWGSGNKYARCFLREWRSERLPFWQAWEDVKAWKTQDLMSGLLRAMGSPRQKVLRCVIASGGIPKPRYAASLWSSVAPPIPQPGVSNCLTGEPLFIPKACAYNVAKPPLRAPLSLGGLLILAI